MLESARLAFRTLRGHLFRTFLTMLSVTIGAFSIVVMLSLAQSGQGTLSKAVEEIGGMRLVLWIPPDDAAKVTAHDKAVYDRGFTQADLQRLAEVPYLEKVTSESQYGTERVYAQADNARKADVVGMQAGLLDVLSWKLATDARSTTRQRREAARRRAQWKSRRGASSPIGTSPLPSARRSRPPSRTSSGVLEKRDCGWACSSGSPGRPRCSSRRSGGGATAGPGREALHRADDRPSKNDTVTAPRQQGAPREPPASGLQSLDFSGFLESSTPSSGSSTRYVALMPASACSLAESAP